MTLAPEGNKTGLQRFSSRYGTAVGITAAVILIKLQSPAIGQHAPFFLGSLTVVLSSLCGGFGPGLLSSALVTVAFGYLFMPPPYSFKVGVEGILGLNVFALEAAVISWLVAGRARSEEAVNRLNADLDRRVRERTAQLEVANRELEAFSYSVSHDLRQPLGVIGGYGHLLLEQRGEVLGETGRDYLERVLAMTARMSKSIEDMLQFSIAQRAALQRQRLDLSLMSEAIVAELRQLEPNREVSVTIASGLTALADQGLVRVVLQNLIENAWKFTKRQPRPYIEIGMVERAGNDMYFTRDNGAGFRMEDASKLFDAFQRLHDAREFPGTGIGLATVRRIVERHGGRIWAEGALGRGATFYFTLGEATRATPDATSETDPGVSESPPGSARLAGAEPPAGSCGPSQPIPIRRAG